MYKADNLGGLFMIKNCQYCSNVVTGYRIILSIHNIGGEAVSHFSADRPAGIISVYRHHPVAVCDHHYHNLPRHVRHHTNNRGLYT